MKDPVGSLTEKVCVEFALPLSVTAKFKTVFFEPFVVIVEVSRIDELCRPEGKAFHSPVPRLLIAVGRGGNPPGVFHNTYNRLACHTPLISASCTVF